MRDGPGNPSRSHVRYRLVGGAGRGRDLHYVVCPLKPAATPLHGAMPTGRPGMGAKGAGFNFCGGVRDRAAARASGKWVTMGRPPFRDSPEQVVAGGKAKWVQQLA